MSDIVREIAVEMEVDFIGVSGNGKGTVSSSTITITHDVREDISGKNLLLAEDVVDTGNTLSALKQMLLDRGSASI